MTKLCRVLEIVALARITFFSMAIRNTYNKKKTYEADARCAEIGNKKYLYAQFPNLKKGDKKV